MALQLYDQPDSSKTLALREEDSEEARQKRLEDAEVLAAKLRIITETVPHRIQNIMGSNAGAGSGEFHMYRQARRREQMRLERIEEQDKREEDLAAHQAKLDKLRQEDEERTAKRRAKRQRKKEKQQTSKKARTGEPPSEPATGNHGNSETVAEPVQYRPVLPEPGLD